MLEQLLLNFYKLEWRSGTHKIRGLRRSKRFMDHMAVLQRCLVWLDGKSKFDTTIHVFSTDIKLLREFSDTF